MRLIVSLLACVVLTSAYQNYQNSIPNGGSVPHPCKANYIWQGVGHQNALGGGARNPFGIAFAAANYEWTADLCNADSDGDGKSNGEELGDPNCAWNSNSGSAPEVTIGLSHPGVYEPTDTAEAIAANTWGIDCSEGADLTCDGFNDADLLNVSLTFTETVVPADETSYMCQKFTIPDDQEYHIIATKPIIANAQIMHHTIIYGCPGGVEGFDTPQLCGMSTSQCDVMLGGWTVGSNGNCFHNNAGVLAGKGHYKTILVEHHWNNPELRSDYKDSSGTVLYMTPNLRPNNGGVVMTGQLELNIPPNEAAFEVHGLCSGSCTQRRLNQSIFITQALLHMHYLGASGGIEQYREGNLVADIVSQPVYSYDSPEFVKYSSPLELKPGDAVKTNCVFKSTSRTKMTHFGEATSDEMCLGFLWYYPVEAGLRDCVNYRDSDSCEIEDYYKWLAAEEEKWALDGAASSLLASVTVITAALFLAY